MFEWMSKKGKNACGFLIWFFIFTYIPVIPTYFLMSFKGLFGLIALIYFVFSMLIVLKLYLKYENIKNSTYPNI
jgi:hypothetical protein